MDDSGMYDDVIVRLRESYNRNASERNHYGIETWKVEERQHFLAILQAEGKTRLLEIGAGPGRDSKFFQDNGLDVVCTDLSPEMVELCRAKGLTAHVMDFLSLDFPAGLFEAVYALNCLLHVPKKDLPKVLETIKLLLKPDGLFYLGVYGKDDFEGIWEQDVYEPKRYFSFYTDEGIQQIVSQYFEVVYFKAVPLEDDVRHFQSMILRRR
jgi:SAM-dependent methyltransferase